MQNTGVKGGKGGGGKYNISKVYHMHTTVLFYIEVPATPALSGELKLPRLSQAHVLVHIHIHTPPPTHTHTLTHTLSLSWAPLSREYITKNLSMAEPVIRKLDG